MVGSAIRKINFNKSIPYHCGMFIVVSHCLIHHETGGMIVGFTEISFSVSHKMKDLFLKFRAPHKGPDETFYLAKSCPELL